MPPCGSSSARRLLWPAALGMCLLSCVGCVTHASPEACKLLVESKAAYGRGEDAVVVAKTGEFLAQNAHCAEADVAYYLRGLAEYRAKNLSAARDDLKLAAARARRADVHLGALKALGDLAFDTGDASWAETLYRQVLDSAEAPGIPIDEVRYRLGCALQHAGQWEQADAQFDRVLHDDPQGELARRAGRRTRGRAWTIQTGAFARKDLADGDAARLTKAGVQAAVRPVVVDGSLRFLVQVGWYEAYPQAAADVARVRKAVPGAFLTTTR